MASRSAVYRIFVGNIPWTINRNELREFFSKFGHVSSARVIFDRETGLNKGHGFVTYSTKDGYLNALKDSTAQLEGNIVKMQPSLAQVDLSEVD